MASNTEPMASNTTNNDSNALEQAVAIPAAPAAAATDNSANNSATAQSHPHLPPHLRKYLPEVGGKFYEGEEKLRTNLINDLISYGVTRLSKGGGCHKNHNDQSMKLFPSRRFNYVCGACNSEQRGKDGQGCCGIKIRVLLVDKEDDATHLVVREFSLPSDSKHLLVSRQVRELSASKIITHEDMLSPTKTNFLKTLGKNRAKSTFVTEVMSDQFKGIQINKNLMHRIMKKGREDAWGGTSQESMMVFYGEGLKLQQEQKYGVHGKFYTNTCTSTGKLVCWYEQHPIEVLNAIHFGCDGVWNDLTHNATTYVFKTGVPSVVDWSGMIAPAGLYQVPEEEIESCQAMLIGLQLNTPKATNCTDGGSAWPAIVEEFDQNQVEDTFHNDMNADKKTTGMDKNTITKVKEMKSKVLYHVFAPEAKLDELLSDFTTTVQGHKEMTNWVKRIEEGKMIRTATHSTKFFSVSAKGATSRNESAMSRLKASGNLKAEMRHWSLGELQARHSRLVANYIVDATEEMKDAIKEGRVFSKYVSDIEDEERRHTDNLIVTEETPNVSNPFHGVQQSSRNAITISVHCLSEQNDHGLELLPHVVDSVCTLTVQGIAQDSMFVGSALKVGMSIHTVNGQTFNGEDEDRCLLTPLNGRLDVLAYTVPSIGTVYTISRKSGLKMERTVFIPDATGNENRTLHCQSSFHVHTAFFVRCRYIQRALMDHKHRSMRDDSTMHKRWHITSSPLYASVRQNMINLMEIEGLGSASLPGFLTTTTPVATAADADQQDEDYFEEPLKKKIRVPTNKTARYNAINVKATQIASMAKTDPAVFRMVLPQMTQMYDNCVAMLGTKSAKVKAAQMAITEAQHNLPIVPMAARREQSDDVNHANLAAKKKQKKKRKKKSAAKIPQAQSEVGALSSASGGRKRKAAAASSTNESASKRPATCVAEAVAIAPAEVDVVAPVLEVVEVAPSQVYAGAELVTNKSVVWLYKLCDQLRESTNTVTTALELSRPAIIVLDDIRSGTETQFTNLTYARMLRKEYKKKGVAVSSQFITTLANKCDALIKSEEEVTGAEMRKLFAHISLKK